MSEGANTVSTFYRSQALAADGSRLEAIASCAVDRDAKARKMAYLVSEYPKVSHSFIRREIIALERLDWSVKRLSIRCSSTDLVDPADIRERSFTTCVLKQGAPALVIAVLKRGIKRPARFVQALVLALSMARKSDKPLIWHLIYFAEASWIASALEKDGIKHLHAHFGSNPAEVAMLVSVLADISYSFTVHGPDEFDRARSIHLGEKISRSKMVAAISSYSRSQLLRISEVSEWPKIRVVHCGIDTAFSAITSVVPSLAKRLVCVGRLCEQKGQLLLLEAVTLLRDQGCVFELVLVGDGELREPIERMIAQRDLSQHVRITGWASADTVKQEMLSARALIMPSFAEGLPVVIMEAMVLGRPVLATYIAGIPELVVDGKSGWLFPAGSVEHMAEAIRSCLEAGEGQLQAMGEFSRYRALERHDIDREVLKLDELFRAAVGE